MNAFYHKTVKTGMNALNEDETIHCVHVLRHQVGDEILILDGKGGQYHSIITSISKKNCSFQVIKSIKAPKKPFRIHLAIAPTKSIDRMEWLVEKLTEIGVDEISLIQTKNSERRKIRIDRIEKKALSALKQSKNTFLPQVNRLIGMEQFINEEWPQKKLIAHVNPGLKHISEAVSPEEEVVILVGPEGDFTDAEVALAIKNDFLPISLGPNTLRTETAGLVACGAINLLNKY